MATPLRAQTLNTTDFQIEWKVTNRFRLFNDPSFFKLHENAWRQYLIHVNEQNISDGQKALLVSSSSVLGSEHVLNDRYIAFSRLERSNPTGDRGLEGRLIFGRHQVRARSAQ